MLNVNNVQWLNAVDSVWLDSVRWLWNIQVFYKIIQFQNGKKILTFVVSTNLFLIIINCNSIALHRIEIQNDKMFEQSDKNWFVYLSKWN